MKLIPVRNVRSGIYFCIYLELLIFNVLIECDLKPKNE